MSIFDKILNLYRKFQLIDLCSLDDIDTRYKVIFVDTVQSPTTIPCIKNIMERLNVEIDLYSDYCFRIDVPHITELPCSVRSIEDYNLFFTSKSLWEKYSTPVLICQPDSFVIEKEITPFLNEDFIGAPCHFDRNSIYRNGGFSIRNPLKHLEICRSISPTTRNEDMVFCEELSKRDNCSISSYDKSLKFSVESVYFPNPFGIHKAYQYMNKRMFLRLFKNFHLES